MLLITTEYIKERAIIDPQSGCWLWRLALKNDGYGVATAKRKCVRAHRLSWELFRGKIPVEMNVLHHCDVRHCVNPDHLFLGTHKDNSVDMVNKGRSLFGEKHNQAKLSTKEVIAILTSKQSHRRLAKEYGVCAGMICHIKAGRNWKHIKAIVDSKVLE